MAPWNFVFLRMSAEGMAPGARGLAMLSTERWQRLQDHFAQVLRISLRTLNRRHAFLSHPSWPSGLDPVAMASLLKLGDELEELLPAGVDPLRQIRTVTTPIGVSFAAIPLRIAADDVIAYLIAGPVVLGKREADEVDRRRLATLGVDADTARALLLTIRLYSFGGIRSVLRLLEDVGNALLELAEQSPMLHATMPHAPKIELRANDKYLERLLSSLLDVAASATEAEGGSIMTYDASREVLEIRAARGLSEEVIATTRLAPGQGLAGIALADRTLLILDERTEDARLRSRMTRRDLVSSLVAPLATDASAEPIGVLSLRTTNPQRRFREEQIETLRRLVHLAGVALAGLHATPPRSFNA